MKTLVTLCLAVVATAANLFAVGGGGLLIASSEALEKQLELWELECGGGPSHTKAPDCGKTKKRLVNELADFAEFCDTNSSASGEGPWVDAWKLQTRAARYHIKYMGHYNNEDAKQERLSIVKAKSAIPKEMDFAHVGLLADDGIIAASI